MTSFCIRDKWKGITALLTLEGKQIKINSITSKTLNSQTNSGFYFGKTLFIYVHL